MKKLFRGCPSFVFSLLFLLSFWFFRANPCHSVANVLSLCRFFRRKSMRAERGRSETKDGIRDPAFSPISLEEPRPRTTQWPPTHATTDSHQSLHLHKVRPRQLT